MNGIAYYENFTCDPRDNDDTFFNIWEGFKATLVPEVNIELIQPILDLIFNIWCKKDKKQYDYFITWLHYLISKPGTKTQKCIFGYSHMQGTGKSTLGFYW